MCDGVRLNNAIYRSGHLQNSLTVDPNAIEVIEIVFGPSSTIYGSDALGGVIHFYTKSPQFSKNNKLFSYTSVSSSLSSVNENKSIHFDQNIGGKNIANFFSVTWNSFGDLKMGKKRFHGYNNWALDNHYINNDDQMVENENPNIQIGTGYHQLDLLNNLTWKINKNWILKFNNSFSTTSQIPRYDNLQDYTEEGVLKWSEWSYGPQTRLFSCLKSNYYKSNFLYDQIKIITAYQFIEEDRITRKYQSNEYHNTYVDAHVGSLNLDFVKKNILYGLEAVNNVIISTATKNTQPRYPSGGSNMTTTALYLSYEHVINKTIILNTGLRYSMAFGKMNFNHTDLVFITDEITFNNNAVTGNLNAILKLGKKYKFDFITSSGFRNPNIDDYGKVFIKRDDIIIPNPELTPEYAYNLEVGITKKQPDKTILTTNMFYTHLKDAIIKKNLGYTLIYNEDEVNVHTLQNSAKSYIYGYSVSITSIFNSWLEYKSSLCFQKGYDISNNEALGHIPPIFGKSLIKSNQDKWGMKLWADYSFYKNILNANEATDNTDLATESGWPMWWTLNTSFQYKINNNLNINFNIENILDQHYMTFSSGLSAPGRNLILAMYFSY